MQFATALVVHVGDHGRVSFLGSAALYGNRRTALTAAHCLPVEAADGAYLVRNGKPHKITKITYHDDADLALVKTDEEDDDERYEFLQYQVFKGVPEVIIEGGDFFAYGYVAEGPISGPEAPVGRHFKGNVQRYFGYDSPQGYTYFAGELSIPAPSGLSGGPVAYAHQPQLLCGIVTTNVESYAILDSIEEAETTGQTTRYESRRVLSYALCVFLSGFRDWIEEHTASDG